MLGARSPHIIEESDEDYEAESVVSGSSGAPAGRNGTDYDEDDLEYSDEQEYEGDAEPRFLIYFWAGARAKKSDWVLWKLELAKTMIPEWQKVSKVALLKGGKGDAQP